jgi:hypothetical protein
MTRKPEFVQLEAGDDATSVRDRLSFIRGQRVLLIWPEEGTVLTRKLDLVLVQREAMRRAIHLALVTHDPQVIQHARELNISTFDTIGASERARWKRGRSKVFTNRFQRPKDEPIPEELMEVASRIRAEEQEEARGRRRIVRAIVLVMLLGITATMAYVVLPGAVIRLIPAQERIQVETQIIADPQALNVDVQNAVIPAITLRVEVEETGTVPATGTQDLADVPARGSVVFINQTSRRVEIPAGTIVSTSAGTPILYRTTQAATVPGGVGQQLEVPIEALQESAGSIGNVDAGLINVVGGELADLVTVRNLTPTTGGESRTLSAVSPNDQQRLLDTVRQQLQARAYTEMLPRLSETQFIIIETLRIAEEREDWMTFSANPGDVAESLTLTMRAVVEAIAVDEQFGWDIAFTQMQQQIPVGRGLKPETVSYERGPVLSIDANQRIAFVLIGSGLVSGQVNVGLLRERIAGRSLDEAQQYLLSEVDIEEGTTPQITVSPDWFGRLPLLPMRINVELQDTLA